MSYMVPVMAATGVRVMTKLPSEAVKSVCILSVGRKAGTISGQSIRNEWIAVPNGRPEDSLDHSTFLLQVNLHGVER